MQTCCINSTIHNAHAQNVARPIEDMIWLQQGPKVAWISRCEVQRQSCLCSKTVIGNKECYWLWYISIIPLLWPEHIQLYISDPSLSDLSSDLTTLTHSTINHPSSHSDDNHCTSLHNSHSCSDSRGQHGLAGISVAMVWTNDFWKKIELKNG